MNKITLGTIALIIAVLLGGCAASYKPIDPLTLNYNSHDLQDGMGLSYKYDVLRERGNRKFSRKEDSKGIKLIAVKVTNNSDTTINVGRDVVFYSGQNQIIPMEPLAIKNTIKQIVQGYLPYFIFTFLNLYVYKGNTVETHRVGLVLGPSLTIGNMVVAGTANTDMLNELNEYNILNKNIGKGETAYGIIGVKDVGYSPISLRFKNN